MIDKQHMKNILEKHGVEVGVDMIYQHLEDAGKLKPRSVALSDDQADYAKSIGGSVSAGVRLALVAHKSGGVMPEFFHSSMEESV
ncbi:MAG TPA: hypothetical protein VKY62_01475 [Devosia sp.]|nr:hypothetical protein [Devosia sp.]